MTQRQTTRSRVLRRVGAAIAATIAVSTVATASGNAARVPQAPKMGGDIKVAIFDTFPGWCSGNNPANSSLMATRTIYETLFEKTVGGDMVGSLADFATVSPDLLTWTIKLRTGIKFHDGTDMTASVVKFNLDAGRGAATLAGQVGAHVIGTAVPFLGNIKSITADDAAATVTIGLDRPANDLPSTLYASGRSFIRAKAQLLSSSTCSTKPIGTGPFKVASDYVFNTEKLVVVRNPDYWRKDAKGNQLPYLNSIQFDNIKESNSRSRALQSGGYDAGMFTSGEGTFVKNLRLKKSLLTEFKSPSEYYPSFWFNQVVQPQFANIHCRKAVSYGIDRVAYVKARTQNEATPAKSIVGPNSVMYSTKGFIQYSKKRAKSELALCLQETNKTDLTFTIPADTSNTSLQNVKYIQKQLAAVGITMNYKQEEGAVIIGKAFNTAGGNKYDAIIILLLEGTDVGFNLPFLVTNSFPATATTSTKYFKGILGSILSLTRHSDTEVDRLLYAAQALPNGTNGSNGSKAQKAALKTAYHAATEYIQKTALISSIAHGYYTLFAKKSLGGIGELKLPSGKTQRVVTNWGIDWTGVYKK